MFFCVEGCLRQNIQKNIGLRPINRRNTTSKRFWWKCSFIWVFCIGNTEKCHFSILRTLKWFLCNFDHEWSCLARPDQHFEFFFSISCPVFDVWRHLLTSFCNISQIWQLDRLFEQLNLIITKYLYRVKLLSVTRAIFCLNFLLYHVSFWTYDVISWRHFVLFH